MLLKMSRVKTMTLWPVTMVYLYTMPLLDYFFVKGVFLVVISASKLYIALNSMHNL
jgi:hypothetical protein